MRKMTNYYILSQTDRTVIELAMCNLPVFSKRKRNLIYFRIAKVRSMIKYINI